MSAALLLAALGTDEPETEAELVRAYAGAVILAEALHDLSLLRQTVQKALSKS